MDHHKERSKLRMGRGFCGEEILKNTGHSFFNDLMSLNGNGTLLDSLRVILAPVPCYLGCLTSLYCLTRPQSSIHHMPYTAKLY